MPRLSPRTYETIALLTLHAYASWMPDRVEGFYKNRSGLHAQNLDEAAQYTKRPREDNVCFNAVHQQLLLDEARLASSWQNLRLFVAATDRQHLHLLVGFDGERTPKAVRVAMKTSVTRRLNAEFARRTWFSGNGTDRLVRNREHFVHLCDEYLLNHRGLRWDWREEATRDPTAGR